MIFFNVNTIVVMNKKKMQEEGKY